jgi:hypothetical protein
LDGQEGLPVFGGPFSYLECHLIMLHCGKPIAAMQTNGLLLASGIHNLS